ncbi:Phox-like protein [Suhomyces tanzawaensis NRRL Y-17324]|uniref:Phox-like protein n=1 Tax=Suhomyces tanzawaensis NRRL Y-17324 TaxID=984487 RepID=A0A1E4SNE0_9ASCO|nr:Phox-like protein [Suhomyces tanzawaensis NRRL Y-17324]ODV81015.1 Phox-like protein [Suhomyces tanzawaensis NRRL Y-17324]
MKTTKALISLPITAPVAPGTANAAGSPFGLAGPLRSLTILKPSPKNQIASNLRSNIILVSKYPFKAESRNELLVAKGAILKLLDRPGNGWLLVKYIDKVLPPGLIPACYVEIAINDTKNPVTMEWLQSNNAQKGHLSLLNEQTYLHLQLKQSSGPPLTINNRAYPTSVSISNFLLFKQRYWYRLDVVLSDGTQCYVCRYYQDFYNLHVNLLNLLNKSLAPLNDTLKLPKLPEPIPSRNIEDENAEESQIQLLLKRCNDLNVYINRLILNRNYQLSDVLIDWLSVSYKGLPGFKVKKESANMDNDAINDKILPDSVNVIKAYYEKVKVVEEPKEMETSCEPPKRNKSKKNIFNHYQQVTSSANIQRNVSTRSQASFTSNNSSPNTPNTTFNSSFHNSISSMSSSSSPGLSRTPTNAKIHVKCKITNFNDEIVAIRFKRSLIRSISDLKHLVKQKVYFTKLFIKLPNTDIFRNIDEVNLNMTEYLKHNDKFNLKLA